EWAGHQGTRMPLPHNDLALSGEGCAGVLFQRRLGIEGVDVADAAAHEQRDDALGARRKVGLLRSIRIEADGLGVASRVAHGGRPEPILIEKMSEGQTAQAAAGFKQKIASGPKSLHELEVYQRLYVKADDFAATIQSRSIAAFKPPSTSLKTPGGRAP